jgi:DNA repair protein RadC
MAAAFMDIKVLDHIIVTEEGYFSFADEGMM